LATVNTLPKISDPSGIIERLGGRQLYGDDPIVPIRELLQNSVDAIRARRFVDPRFSSSEVDKYPGKILIKLEKIADTDDYWLAVEDNGVGMSERTITRSLLDFGTSFWSSAAAAQLYPGLPSEKKFRPIGRFGIGFFSVFMYSDVVTVMSREFGSATNIWNVLSFTHGVRGRGNLSIEGMPTEIRMSDASTRVKVRVKQGFIRSLQSVDEGSIIVSAEEGQEFRESEVTRILERLVCALDVCVELQLLDGAPAQLNAPLIYERGADVVWSVIRFPAHSSFDASFEANQKQLLGPLGTVDDELYGYCGVSLRYYPNAIIKSVGGMCSQEYYSTGEPIAGIAEYEVAAANRLPHKLRAPQHVIDAWAKEQIRRINQMELPLAQRIHAWEHLGQLVNDIRPIYVVQTSVGPLNLDNLIVKFREEGSAIIPVSEAQSQQFFGRLPVINVELNLDVHEIDFSRFSICIFDEVPIISIDSSGRLRSAAKPGIYKTGWDTIHNVLCDLECKFELLLHRDYSIGRYAGLDSARHGVRNGDEILNDALEIRLLTT